MALPLSRLEQLNTKECLWIYILRILADREMHAYAIRGEIERRFGFQPGIMTAYKVLYLLRREGFVRQTSQGRKKVYQVTERGKRELQQAASFYGRLGKMLSTS